MAELSSSSPLEESSRMPCHDCSVPTEKSPGHGLSGRAHRLISTMLPEGFALLSSSCCWLPVCSIHTCTHFSCILAIGRRYLTSFLLVPSPQLACKSYASSFWPFLSWPCPLASRLKASAMGIFGAQSFVRVYWSGRSIVSGVRVIMAVTDVRFEESDLAGFLDEY